MEETRTRGVGAYGQSLWYDNISREVLRGGKLSAMIRDDGVAGVTSNPTIFMKAIAEGTDYDEDIRRLAAPGRSAEEITQELMIGDIREAADILKPVFEKTEGKDGYVSLEVSPDLAYDAAGTVREATRFFEVVDRPNIMIKVPGTEEGAGAVRDILAEGINVNITLLFSPEHYRRVALAYIDALERRQSGGLELGNVHSVASFFLSRIDNVIDPRLDRLAGAVGEEAAETVRRLRGEAAVAVARVTYGIFRQLFFSDRFQKLAVAGGNIQRPLWASTGTKDPSYSDVKYVEALIGPYTVNTLPQSTIDAFRDHGRAAETVTAGLEEAGRALEDLESFDIRLEDIYADLQEAGVKAFADSYQALVKAVGEKAGL